MGQTLPVVDVDKVRREITSYEWVHPGEER
jgi:hypothetical protein